MRLRDARAARRWREDNCEDSGCRKVEEVARLFEFADVELGGLGILVNNAGVGVFRAVGELTVEEWDRVIGINLSGAFYAVARRFTGLNSRAAVPSSISAV